MTRVDHHVLFMKLVFTSFLLMICLYIHNTYCDLYLIRLVSYISDKQVY